MKIISYYLKQEGKKLFLTNHIPAYRLRVGDYRILFDVYEDKIEVGIIKHRKDVYEK